MSGIVSCSIGGGGSALVVLDEGRRTYAGLSRDGTYHHLIQPASLEDPRVGDGLRKAGELVCTCSGGRFRGTCYRIEEAESFERRLARAKRDQVAWLEPESKLEALRG